MSDDGRGTTRKSWKAFQVNYDTIRAASERLCCHCLSEQQVLAVMSMIEYLRWPSRWVSDTEDIDRDFIDAFASGLEFQIMSGCADENIPIQYRYSSAGVLQRSLNGGGTWTDAPLYDPRVNSPVFPPISGADGSDKRCAAAASAAVLIQEQVGDQLTDDMTRYTLAQLITDWTQVYIGTSNPFQALLTVIANQIFALVIATLRPALTSTVYDQLRCIIYCNMSGMASIDGTQWQQIRSDITDQIGGIAGVFLEHLVYLLGNGGMTNLVRSGAVSEATCDDCTECPDPSCPVEYSFYAGWTVVSVVDDLYTLSYDGGGAHLSFTSGDNSLGCYCTTTGLHGLPSWWLLGSMSPSTGIDPTTNRVWNFDTDAGGYATGDIVTFQFSNVPLS
jgi:hypothetical protein